MKCLKVWQQFIKRFPKTEELPSFPIWSMEFGATYPFDEGTTKRINIRLWTVATYAAKDRVLARMKIPRPGPGYMHLPDWTTEEYLEQLTGEKKITVRDRRTRTRKPLYVKTYTRNEALDLTVYCHAGLFILQNFIEPVTYRCGQSILRGPRVRGGRR